MNYWGTSFVAVKLQQRVDCDCQYKVILLQTRDRDLKYPAFVCLIVANRKILTKIAFLSISK